MGAAGLGKTLAASPTFRTCVSRVWFRYAFGRTEDEQDACTIGELDGALAKGGRVRDLVVSLVGSDAFRHRVSP